MSLNLYESVNLWNNLDSLTLQRVNIVYKFTSFSLYLYTHLNYCYTRISFILIYLLSHYENVFVCIISLHCHYENLAQRHVLVYTYLKSVLYLRFFAPHCIRCLLNKKRLLCDQVANGAPDLAQVEIKGSIFYGHTSLIPVDCMKLPQ